MLIVEALLPGTYLFAVSALLVWVLGRWFDPVPRRAVAVFALLLLVFFGPVLFAGGILLPLDNLRSAPPFQDLDKSPVPGFRLQGDQLEDFAPYFSEVRRHLAAGQWPLSNPRVGAGEPLLVNSQAQHFQLLMLLTYPFPLSAALGLIAAFKVLLALLFTFLLFRRLGLGEEAALAGSVAYGAGGFMMLYLGWPQTQSAAFLPLMLYALERVIERLSGRDLLLFAIATSALLLAGHPETVLYAVAMSGLFALARIRRQPVRQRWRAAIALAATGGALTLLTAPVLLPTLIYAEQSERYHLVESRRQQLIAGGEEKPEWPGRGSGSTFDGLERRALPLVAPVAFGSQRYGAYWGETTIFQDASGFVGSAAILAALLACLPVGAARRFPAERLMLWVGLGCSVIFIQPPGMKSLLAVVPVVGHSASYHRRLTMILCLCLAYLAACTWERWQRHGLPRRRLLLLAVGLAAVITWAYVAHPLDEAPETLAAYRGRWLHVQLLALLAATALLAQDHRLMQTGAGRAWAPWTMVLVVAFELSVLHGDLNPPMPQRLYFPTTPSIEFLQRHVGQDRMVALGPNFRHNLPVIYGINDLRSGNPLQPFKLLQITRPVRRSPQGRRVVVAHHPVYDLLGVRYVAVRPGERFRRPLKLVFDQEMWVYERPNPLPRLFLPSRGTLLAADDPGWADAVLEIRNYARRALFSVPRRAGEKRWQATGGDTAVDDLEILATRISGRLALEEPRLLASSVYQDGGWRLLVDRGSGPAPVPTLLSNGAFVGAWLEEGDARLELLYRPPGFLAGCLLAALASAALLAAAAVGFAADRRPDRVSLGAGEQA